MIEKPRRADPLAFVPLLGALPAIFIALIGFGAHDSGAFERVPCGREVEYRQTHAELNDPYVEGYITVGFEFSVTIQEAIRILDSQDAHWTIDHPYRHNAQVCTFVGEEQEWADRFKAIEGVQFARTDGVNPQDLLN